MRRRQLLTATAFVAMAMAGAAKATTYINDPDLSHFASASTDFATLSNFQKATHGVPSPYATTFASLDTGDRVYEGGTLTGLPGGNWILATFGSALSSIRVFPNIDHPTKGPDGYQYSIEGSNDGTHWTALFNPDTVGAGPPFELTSFTGTAPTQVDAVETAACINAAHDCVGYIADFTFANAYKYYAFGSSVAGVPDQGELSGVSALTTGGVPEPAAWTMLLGSLGLVGAALRSQRRKAPPIPA
jgi:hypothetical protein